MQYGAINSDGKAYCVPYKYATVRYNYTITYALNGSVGYSTSAFNKTQVSQGRPGCAELFLLPLTVNMVGRGGGHGAISSNKGETIGIIDKCEHRFQPPL